MKKVSQPVYLTASEAAEIKSYIEMLESRSTWARNEINKYRASRAIRLANVLSDIRQSPLDFRVLVKAPFRLFRCLSRQTPVKSQIERTRFPAFQRRSLPTALANIPTKAQEPVRQTDPSFRQLKAWGTITNSLHQATALGLREHKRVIGVVDPARLRRLNSELEFFSVRPDNFDFVARTNNASAFIFDPEFALYDKYWRGSLSIRNIQASIAAAQSINLMKGAGLAMFLVFPENPERFSFLKEVRGAFDVEITK